MLDLSSEYGARVDRRLREERVIWLVTASPNGQPQPSPVWFLWDGQTVLMFSEPDRPKLRNIAANPKVALHLNSTPSGGDVVVLTGTAEILPPTGTDDLMQALLTKYEKEIPGLNTTPEELAKQYNVLIRFTPRRVRGE